MSSFEVLIPPFVHPTAVVEGAYGKGTRIGALAWIGPNVTIGENCRIGPGAKLGQDGFGYEHVEGRWVEKPQSFGVVIEDDVHIGANTCIDRGSYRDTRVRRGTRIDNGVHLAHNGVIGEDCLIIALAMLAGSVELGDGCYVAPCAAIREHVKVGAGAFIGLGAVVVRDVEPGEHVKGVPAKAFHPMPPAGSPEP